MSKLCKCGKPHDNWTGAAGGLLCQVCWENECSDSWWEMVRLLPTVEDVSEVD